jgi:2-iminobutanoate/2-iminopropanoate deaminase
METAVMRERPSVVADRGGSMLSRVACAVAVIVLFSVASLGAERQVIRPKGTTPGGNYSPGILVDGTLYISGQAGEDANGKIPTDFEAEVKQALDNIGVVLSAAGMSPTDVVSVQVYLTDGALFKRMNAVYTGYFKDPRPTRTTVVVAALVGEGHIEITTTARKSSARASSTAPSR